MNILLYIFSSLEETSAARIDTEKNLAETWESLNQTETQLQKTSEDFESVKVEKGCINVELQDIANIFEETKLEPINTK